MIANLIVLVVELWLFGAVGLWLHQLSARFGMLPVTFFIAALVAVLQYSSPLGIFVSTDLGLNFVVGSTVYVPVILLLMIVVYIVNGTKLARRMIFGLLAITLLILLILGVQSLHLALPGGGNLAGIPAVNAAVTPNPREVFASFSAFVIDLALVAVIYQAMTNRLRLRGHPLPVWLPALSALIFTVVIDAVVFQTLAMFDHPLYAQLLVSNSIGKAIAALLLAPFLVFYLRVVVPRQPKFTAVQERPVFDLWNVNLRKVLNDLTRSQSALEASEDNFRRLIENIDEIFWLADAQMDVMYYISPAFENIWGRRRAEFYLHPETLLQTVHPEDQPLAAERMIAGDEKPRELEYRIMRPNGEVCWVRERIFPIINASGERDSYAGLIEDITARKNDEQQNFELALARERVGLMRNFISDASHDLRTPLTLIGLKIHLLRRTKDPQRQQELFDELEQNIDQLIKLVENLLTLSWLENESVLTYGRVDIARPVGQICEDMRVMAEQRQIELRFEAEANLPRALVVESELMRALTNLISNALKYTPAGGKVTVRCAQQNGTIVITVADTGVGIPPEAIPHLFDRYYRVKGREVDAAGTGLGLAIVKKIVDLHHGSIVVESEVGAGSTFYVYLPLERPTERPIRQVENAGD